jgi:hypothetical protein
MNISSLNPQVNNPGLTSSPGVDLGIANKSSSQANLLNPTKGEKESVSSLSALLSSNSEDKRQLALGIVNKTLTLAYEKISSRGQASSAQYEAFEPLTAEKVANNILGFIERRLQLDVADGASQEDLQARIEAGLSGFKKGFAEASEKLEALSLLSPEIKTDIGQTYDLVLKGVDDLRSKFIQSTEATVEPDTNPAKSTTPKTITSNKTGVENQPKNKLDVPDFLPSSTSSYLGYGNYEYGRAREFSFELTTKEGDKITIKAASSEGLAIEAGRAGRGNQSGGTLNASYSSSDSFSLSVEGDLSEDELSAVNELLGRVNDLAGQFFDGNLDSAFEQAMALGYDDTQISGFSLNLAQSEILQVAQAYQTFEPNNGKSGTDKPQLLTDKLLPLGNFIKSLLDGLDRASVFDEPKTVLSNMAENITGESDMDKQQGKRFRDFMDSMIALQTH